MGIYDVLNLNILNLHLNLSVQRNKNEWIVWFFVKIFLEI